MDSHEICYVACFFDCEGSIGISKSDRSQFRLNASPTYGLYISLVNQDLGTLLWMQQEFRGSLHKRDGAYSLVLQTKIAEKFLLTIRPYVRIKKDQVELALAFQELRASRTTRPKLTTKELDLYDLVRERMQELNHRNSRAFHEKSGEFSESPTLDNTEPNSLNDIKVGEKVQRLTGEESTNNPDTSARHESDNIVRATEQLVESRDKELLS